MIQAPFEIQASDCEVPHSRPWSLARNQRLRRNSASIIDSSARDCSSDEVRSLIRCDKALLPFLGVERQGMAIAAFISVWPACWTRPERTRAQLPLEADSLFSQSHCMTNEPRPMDVTEAILRRLKVRFFYEGHLITAEPHLLGRLKKPVGPLMRAWAIESGWKNFSLRRIRAFTILSNDTFVPRLDFLPPDGSIFEVESSVSAVAAR